MPTACGPERLARMLRSAPASEVARWAAVPEDGRWYTLDVRTVEPNDCRAGADGWPNLNGGHRHWKGVMEAASRKASALLKAFGVEPFCTLCNTGGGFDAHVMGSEHYRNVREHVNQLKELSKEDLWLETCLVGGRVRFSLLDGELQAMRYVPVPLYPAIIPKDLPVAGQWLLVGSAVAVAVNQVGDRSKWPNLWSHRHWSEKMEWAAQRIEASLVANGAHPFCSLCPTQKLTAGHVLSKKHFMQLNSRLSDNVSVNSDDFRQLCTFEDIGGAILFNHLDGSLHMVRRPEKGTVAETAPGPTKEDVMQTAMQRAKTAARVSILPTPRRTVVAEPAMLPPCSPEAVARARLSGSPFADPSNYELPLESRRATASTATAAAGCNAAWDFREVVAKRQVGYLEEVLTKTMGTEMMRYCQLCHQGLPPSQSFTEHVACDAFHRVQVEARYARDKASGGGWWQCWGGVVQLHHWSLDIMAVEGNGFMVETATFSTD